MRNLCQNLLSRGSCLMVDVSYTPATAIISLGPSQSIRGQVQNGRRSEGNRNTIRILAAWPAQETRG